MTFLSVIHNELVIFICKTSQQPYILPTYFRTLTFKTCRSELYLTNGLSTPLLHGSFLAILIESLHKQANYEDPCNGINQQMSLVSGQRMRQCLLEEVSKLS